MTVMSNEDPADPSAHEPRVTDAPETVWLVYSDLDHDATHRECCESGEVTWCEDAQFPADVRYLRADLMYHQAREIAADDWRQKAAAWLRAKADAHEKANRESPRHARASSWEKRVRDLRWDADELEGKFGSYGAPGPNA